MEQRVDIITLGVPAVGTARRFVDGLGWKPAFEVEDVIVFLQLGPGLLLALLGAGDLDADIGVPTRGDPRPSSVTLAHNVGSDRAVGQTLDDALRAGATRLKPAQRADFGGYHGYLADPAGLRWEVAHDPGWRVDGEGRAVIGPVGA